MQGLFKSWDPQLRRLLSKVDSAVKWKIWEMDALDTWVRGCVALLGDACHPSLPYAGSGAALAVEDGASLGVLLGSFSRQSCSKSRLPVLLQLYESVRMSRSALTVALAVDNRSLYNMPDGSLQQQRDKHFTTHDWSDHECSFPWAYADFTFQEQLYAYDAVRATADAFDRSEFST